MLIKMFGKTERVLRNDPIKYGFGIGICIILIVVALMGASYIVPYAIGGFIGTLWATILMFMGDIRKSW
jgi:hypothetical protein